MPDITRKTISATQSPALFNASPYITKWMLYHHLRGADIEPKESGRMSWGKKLQPLVLEQAAEELKLEVIPNFSNQYVRMSSAPIGYTADATIVCPDRGPGTIETKCVFDYGTWQRDWNGGKNPPRHYELQLQQQLAVGNGREPFKWGVIAAWVAGEIHYFERSYMEAVAEEIIEAADEMMHRVTLGDEPEPFGSELEAPLLTTLFPVLKGKTLDLRAHKDGAKWAEHATMLKSFQEQERFYGKATDAAKVALRTLALDNELVMLPSGIFVKQSTRHIKEHTRKASVSTTLKVVVGEDTGGGDDNGAGSTLQ